MNNTNNDRYEETYSDLLDDQADAASLRLIAYLDATFAAIEPPAHLAGSVEQILRERKYAKEYKEARTRWPRRLAGFLSLPRRVNTATALLLAVFVLLGAGYAAMPALERLFSEHTGTGAIISGKLGQEINVSRTVDGFTVTVRRVYADPNQIVIGLTVSGPPGRTFNYIVPWGDYQETPKGTMVLSPILTNKEGREFNGGLGGEQGGIEGGSAPYLLAYEGTGIKEDMKEINVRLRIGMLSAYERLGENKYENIVVKGPFTFDLTIPVAPGRVADLHQTVESGGTSVTLERLVTAPTGTRLSLRGAGPNADVKLTVGGETYTFHKPDGLAIPVQWTADSTWEYISGASLMDGQGEWELTVRPGPTLSHFDPPPTQLEGDPWTFKFTVPPAEETQR